MAICASCGTALPTGAGTCDFCGGAPATDPQPQRPMDILPAPQSRARGGRRTGAVAGVAALTLALAGGAVYGATVLSGDGAQPEDVLPARAFGFVKLDLDPAAGQKVAAYQLAKKFPDSGVTAEGDVKDQLLRAVLPEEDRREYDADVEPWLGDRAGFALLPPAAGGHDEPVVLAAVQYTDRAQAEAGLRRLAARPENDMKYAFAADEDYVLLGEDQATVDAAAAEQQDLADNPAFDRGVEALGGDQIGLGWLDVGGLWRALPEEERRPGPGEPQLDPSGIVVLGAHVAEGTVEVVGRSLGASLGSAPEAKALDESPIGRAPARLVQALPADSVVAAGVSGLGDGLAQFYGALPRDVRESEELQSVLDEFGLRLPDDLRAVFGQDLALALSGDLESGDAQAVLRAQTADPARAVELLEKGRDLAAEHQPSEAAEIDLRTVDGGYAAAFGTQAGPGDPATGLGTSPVFRRTVPDSPTAGLTYYVDVSRFVQQAVSTPDLTDKQRRNLEPLQAAGLTVTSTTGNDGAFRFRLAVRE